MRAFLSASRRAMSQAAGFALSRATASSGRKAGARWLGAAAVAGATFSTYFAFDSAAPPNFDRKRTLAGVMAWGQGGSGQLGFGESCINWLIPRNAEGLSSESIAHIAAGKKHTAVLTKAGEVWTFGCGQYGRLGHGDDEDQLTPRMVVALDGIPVAAVACGDYHTAAVTKEGELYLWGRGWSGELGRSDDSSSEPKLVEALKGKRVVQVSCGDSFTIALTDEGEVYSFGTGTEGQLGLGKLEGSRNTFGRQQVPRKIETLGAKKIVKIATGKEHALAVADNGTVFTWGADDYGQLGLGKSSRYVREPHEVRSLKDAAVDIACGEYHSAIVTKSGKIYTFGLNKDGQLGNGGFSDQPMPRAVLFGSKEEGPKKALTGVVGVACGGGHTAVLTSKGELWVWGRGRDGQLGRGEDLESAVAPRTSPLYVDALEGKVVTNVACGADHTVAIVQE